MKSFSAIVLASVFFCGHCFGMGHGQGTTKIDFQFDTSDATKSRLFAKIDISAALSQLGNSGTPSHNDDLAGYTLTLTVGGSATFSGMADSKGKIAEDLTATMPVPFSAKLTANGKILQIMANGLALQPLLFNGTAPTGNGTFSIEIDVSASKTDSSNVTTTVSLSTQNVTFNYKVKGNTVKGSNH